MESILNLDQAAGLVDNLPKILPVLKQLEEVRTGCLRNAVWVRSANFLLKTMIGSGTQTGEKEVVPAGLLSPPVPQFSSLTVDQMKMNRAVYEVISGAEALRDTLRQAAFQSVFERGISEDLKDQLKSQSGGLRRSYEELYNDYMTGETVVQAVKVSTD